MRKYIYAITALLLLSSPAPALAEDSCPLDKAIYAPPLYKKDGVDTENLTGLALTRDPEGKPIMRITSYDTSSQPLATLTYKADCDAGYCKISGMENNTIRGFDHDLSFANLAEGGRAPEYLAVGFFRGRFYGGGAYPYGKEADNYKAEAELYGDQPFDVHNLPYIGKRKTWKLWACGTKKVKTPLIKIEAAAPFEENYTCANPYYVPHPAYAKLHPDLDFEFRPGLSYKQPHSAFDAFTKPGHKLVSSLYTMDGFTNGSGEEYMAFIRFVRLGSGPHAYVFFSTDALQEGIRETDWVGFNALAKDIKENWYDPPKQINFDYPGHIAVMFHTDDHVLPDVSGIDVWVYGGCHAKKHDDVEPYILP